MSQGNLYNPTSGLLSGLGEVTTNNAAFAALASMNSGGSAPANTQGGTPYAGMLWLNTATTLNIVYIYDGTDWLVVGYLDTVNHVWTPKGPTGSGALFFGSFVPPGALQCYGQILSASAYPALFAAIGGQYGGDGVTTFGIPDLRGRVPAGVDNMGGTPANRLTPGGSGIAGTTPGAAGGVETYALTTAQLASHGHTVTDPGHVHTASTGADTPTHTHAYTGPGSIGGSNGAGTGAIANIWSGTASPNTNADSPQHTHSVTVNSTTTGVTIQSTGSGTAHQNVQPTLMCFYIIWI
jgi:microcystin-dependent protein